MKRENHLQKKYPDLFALYHKGFPFYLAEMKRMNVLTGETNAEQAKKILLTQFCLIILEHLNGIYVLLSSGSFLSPIPLFRAIIECDINWAYILHDTEKHLEQFAGQGLIRHKKMIRKAKDHDTVSEEESDQILKSIEKIDPESVLHAAGKEWEKTTLRDKAEILGQDYLRAYDLGFAYFSGYTHPSAFGAENFVSYTENGSIRYHYFNKDFSEVIMRNSLKVANRMMKTLAIEFNLGKMKFYDQIDHELDSISNN